jgi:ABC-2 type transport system ATP-binding protein
MVRRFYTPTPLKGLPAVTIDAEMPGDTVLTVEAACKAYGRIAALQGASLTLRDGEWLGLLGPNGAGKTTLVRAIAGRVRLDSGHVRLLGRDLAAASAAESRAARQRLGVVPQEVALYAYLTARENLEVFGSLSGLTGAAVRERVRWALDLIGLAERAGDRVGGFSGGMKRRLNIACSILHRPDVILLDEPTVGVDPQSRERIWEMLGRLQREGASLLLTSHQLDEVERLCERIVIIDHGQVIAEGTVRELIDAHLGRGRQVTLVLDREPTESLAQGAVRVVDQRATWSIRDVSSELPGLLKRCDAAGARIEDIHIDAPSLQSVFIHLTGRELRE